MTSQQPWTLLATPALWWTAFSCLLRHLTRCLQGAHPATRLWLPSLHQQFHVGVSSTVLSPELQFTFPTAYLLFLLRHLIAISNFSPKSNSCLPPNLCNPQSYPPLSKWNPILPMAWSKSLNSSLSLTTYIEMVRKSCWLYLLNVHLHCHTLVPFTTSISWINSLATWLV